MKYREVARKLQALGCHEIPRSGGGSHRKWQNLANTKTTVVPDKGGKDLKTGTLRAVIKQLGLDWQDFDSA